MKAMTSYYLMFLLSVQGFLSSRAFVAPGSTFNLSLKPSQANLHVRTEPTSFLPQQQHQRNQQNQQSQQYRTSSAITPLQMGYNLPPGGGGSGGGGGGGDGDKIAEVLTPALTIGAIVLFFMSPLGGIFFAVTNSIFVLVLLAPILIGVGFNVWNYFNTIEGDCPSCGAPARVLKDEQAGPNICLSCGQLIRATENKDGIELCNDPNDIFDQKSRVSSIFDIFTSDRSVYEDDNVISTSTTTVTDIFDDGQKKNDRKRRETTIIDIDVEKE